MTQVIPAVGEVVIVSINYGEGWAQLFDNYALGWLVDEADAVPPAPVVIGTMPPATGDAASPQWGQFIEPNIFVPDVSRTNFYEFLTWLSIGDGSGASRKIGSGLLGPALKNGYQQWATQNPELAFDGDPPAAPVTAAGGREGKEETRHTRREPEVEHRPTRHR